MKDTATNKQQDQLFKQYAMLSYEEGQYISHIINRMARNIERDENYYSDRSILKPEENPLGCIDSFPESVLIGICIMRKLIRDCIKGNISFSTFKLLAQKVTDQDTNSDISEHRDEVLEYMKSEIEKCKEMSVDRKFVLLKFFYEWCGYEFAFENNK